jgi:hypothetical protein
MRMRTVKAWAVVRIVDGREKFDTAFEHKHDAESHMYDVFCPTEVKVVRIVPESEYRRMMAAVRYADATDEVKTVCERIDARDAYREAKRKAVKRGK